MRIVRSLLNACDKLNVSLSDEYTKEQVDKAVEKMIDELLKTERVVGGRTLRHKGIFKLNDVRWWYEAACLEVEGEILEDVEVTEIGNDEGAIYYNPSVAPALINLICQELAEEYFYTGTTEHLESATGML